MLRTVPRPPARKKKKKKKMAHRGRGHKVPRHTRAKPPEPEAGYKYRQEAWLTGAEGTKCPGIPEQAKLILKEPRGTLHPGPQRKKNVVFLPSPPTLLVTCTCWSFLFGFQQMACLGALLPSAPNRPSNWGVRGGSIVFSNWRVR